MQWVNTTRKQSHFQSMICEYLNWYRPILKKVAKFSTSIIYKSQKHLLAGKEDSRSNGNMTCFYKLHSPGMCSINLCQVKGPSPRLTEKDKRLPRPQIFELHISYTSIERNQRACKRTLICDLEGKKSFIEDNISFRQWKKLTDCEVNFSFVS